MRRAIIILPGAFTSGNLFFGIWSIVESARGNFAHAAWFVVVAAVMDGLDGSLARMSRTGTEFGAELDSLVDVVTFGVAPAFLLYFLAFKGGEWAWLLAFSYILAAALRLARFNVEQAGHAKSQFFGLPSPAAGITLATYYPFSQTPFFREHLTGFFQRPPALALLVVMCSVLMVSHVTYPALPRLSIRNARGLLGIAIVLLVIAAALYFPAYFFFPASVAYISFGLARAAILGLLERMPEREPLLDVDEDEASRPIQDMLAPQGLLRFRLRRRRHAGGGGGSGGAGGGGGGPK